MAQTIKLKRSATTGNAPTASQLALGELGINTTDGKLFLKKSVSGTESIVEVGGLPLSGGTLTGNLSLGDNVKLQLGNQTNGDLQIYHDGSHSYIADVGTGDLVLQAGNDLILRQPDGLTEYLRANEGAGVQIYHNGSQKFLTTAAGIDVTGEITADGLALGDSQKATFGASDDLQIYHDGSNSHITDAGTGNLILQATDFVLKSGGTGAYIEAASGVTKLYHSNALKLATTSTGISISNDANFPDNGKAIFGTGSDLQIYHDGSNSYIAESNATGNLFIKGTHISLQNSAGQDALNLINGDAYIKSGGQTKLQTTSSGISVTGSVTADGLTVDGNGLIQANMGAKLEIKSTDNFINNGEVVGSLDFISADYNYTAQPIKGQIRTESVSSTGESAVFISTTETTNLRNRIKIDKGGDISFYEDTGTTAKLFWDSSTSQLRVGSTSAIFTNSVIQGVSALGPTIGAKQTTANQFAGGFWNNNSGDVSLIAFYAGFGGSQIGSIKGNSTSVQLLGSSGSGLSISSTGNVNIPNGSLMVGATAAPVEKLDVSDYQGISVNANYAHMGSTVSGAMAIFGHNIKSDSANNTIKTANTGYHSSMIKMYYDEGITFHATAGTATAGDTFYNISGTTNELMRISNTGSVCIGTDSPIYTAASRTTTTINGASTANLSFGVGGTGYGNIFVASNVMSIGTQTSANPLTFEIGGSEKARIDSSGNLLVGTTSATGRTDASSGEGIALSAGSYGGFIGATRSFANPLALNRLSTDGAIATFAKDGTTVGNIGTYGSDLVITSSVSGHKGLRFGLNHIAPIDTSYSYTDATTDLGLSDVRFKDLYLSSSIKLSNSSYDTGATVTTSISGDLITGQADTGLRFYDGGDAIIPRSTSDGQRNGTTDLGASNARFKDLYLSGGLRGDTTFKNNAGTTEYARFSGGNLLVGTTGANTYSSTVNTGVQIAPDFIGVARNQNTVMHLNRQGNDGTIVDFRTFGFVRGSVSISGSTTSYNTSSDERLKDNIIDAPIASEDIDAIQVRSFDWKADGEHQKYGMVAQELLEVAPDAVTQGDTPDDMMGVDYSKLVPMLIKEIQSLRQRVAQLEE